VPTILGELRRYFREATWGVRPGRDLQERFRLVLDVSAGRERELGRVPTAKQLAARLDLHEEDVVEALQAREGYTLKSLDARVSDDGHDVLGDRVGGVEGGYARVEAEVALDALTAILDCRAREVLRPRFGRRPPQAEIASSR